MFGFGKKVPEISAEELKLLLDKKEDFSLIDVRTQDERSRGKIEGSIHIPLDKITTIESIIKNKNKKIVLYCLSGSRSSAAASMLIGRGFVDVHSMTSGLLAWRAKHYTLS